MLVDLNCIVNGFRITPRLLLFKLFENSSTPPPLSGKCVFCMPLMKNMQRENVKLCINPERVGSSLSIFVTQWWKILWGFICRSCVHPERRDVAVRYRQG